jgi:hypothetical protein
MSDLDQFCKFKIGDVVSPKVQRPGFDARGRVFTPQLLQIVERYIVECYGGIQVNYRLRAHSAPTGWTNESYSFLVELIMLTEPELVMAMVPALTDEPPPPKPRRPKDDPAETSAA